MKDKFQWFKFTPADWMMGRIRKLDKVVQADFMALICVYWNHSCKMAIEDAELEVGESNLKTLLKYKIIKQDSGFIIIDFLDEQLQEIEESESHSSEKGKLGNLKRWHRELYNKVMSGDLSLKEAIALSKQQKKEENSDQKTIAKGSPPDSPPIDTPSLNIADKNRIEENRRERETRALDYLQKNFPTRFETEFLMRYKSKIKNRKKFAEDFNDTVDQEDLPYTDKVLFGRLGKYARNWIQNQDKYSPPEQTHRPGKNIPIG